jgi:hypothetical protein
MIARYRADTPFLTSINVKGGAQEPCGAHGSYLAAQHHLDPGQQCHVAWQLLFTGVHMYIFQRGLFRTVFQSSGDGTDLSRACSRWPEPFPSIMTNQQFLLANIHASLPPLLRIVKLVPSFDGTCLAQPHVSVVASRIGCLYEGCKGWETDQDILNDKMGAAKTFEERDELLSIMKQT